MLDSVLRPSIRPRAVLVGSLVVIASSAALGIAGAVCAVTVVVWRRWGWPSGWVAIPSLVALPLAGALAAAGAAGAADMVATGAFLGLGIAVAIQLWPPRSGTSRDSTSSTGPPQADAARSTGKRQRVVTRVAARIDYWVVGIAAALAAQSWFQTGKLLAFGDLSPLTFLNPAVLWQKVAPLWNVYTDGLGGRNFTVGLMPLIGISSALQSLGFGPSLTQRVVTTALFAAEGWSIVFLLRTVWPNGSRVARLAGALLYLFNTFQFFNLPGIVPIVAFALGPLLAALMLRSLRAGGRTHIVAWAVASLGLAVVATNPSLALVTAVCSLVLAAAVHLATGGDTRSLGRFAARAAPVAILLNLWWLLPAVLTLLGSSSVALIPTSPDRWAWTQARNSFSNLFALNASWAWPQRLYFPYATRYEGFGMSVAVYGPALLAFSSVAAIRSRIPRVVSVLAAIALTLIFLSKGIHAPFEATNRFLATEVPLFWVLREPASKLLVWVLTCFSLLVVYSVDRALDRLRERESAPSWTAALGARQFVIVGFLLPVLALPIFTGELVADERPVLPGTHVKVPGYWFKVAAVLNQRADQSGSILILPLDDFYAMPYRWGYYGPDTIPTELIRRPVLSGLNPAYIPSAPDVRAVLDRAEVGLRTGRALPSRWALRALGVSYVLVRGDIDYSLASRLGRHLPSTDRYLASLAKLSEVVESAGTYGPLRLFRVKDALNGVVEAWPQGATWVRGGGSLPPHLLSSESLPATIEDPHESLLDTVSAITRLSGDRVLVTRRRAGPVRVPLPTHPTRTRAGPGLSVRMVAGGAAPRATPTGLYLQGDDNTPVRVHRAVGHASALVEWGDVSRIVARVPGSDLVRDGSFETGLGHGSAWGALGDCNRHDSRSSSAVGLSASLTDQSRAGDTALRLAANDHAACVSQTVRVRPGRTYEFSYWYKTVDQGEVADPQACLFVSSPVEHCLPLRRASSAEHWTRYVAPFTTGDETTRIGLFFYAFGDQGDRTVTLFDQARIRALRVRAAWQVDWEPRTITRSIVASRLEWRSSGSAPRRAAPAADIDLIEGNTPERPSTLVSSIAKGSSSPSIDGVRAVGTNRYEIRVKDARAPFILSFNQAFDPGWTLEWPTGERVPSTHFMANGYSNAWVVDRQGSYTVRIEFEPERFAQAASWISTATLLVFAGVAIAALMIKRRGDS